jgi:hypothetical protein
MARKGKAHRLTKSKSVSTRLEQSFYDCWVGISNITGVEMTEIMKQGMIRTYNIKRTLLGEYYLPEQIEDTP